MYDFSLPLRKAVWGCGLLLLSVFPVSSQTQSPPRPAIQLPVPPKASEVDPVGLRTTYLLGPGDQIQIQVLNVPEISEKSIRLDPAGDINLPMVGRLHAAGLTAEQVELELGKRLKVYLEQPDVAVSVAEFHSQPVSVIGEVAQPGIHQVESGKTLIEILSTVGGLKPEAGPTLRITRRIESAGRIPLPSATDDPTGKYSIAEVDIRPLVEGRTPEKNVYVRAYDVISVPRAQIIYVIGDVGKVGPLVLNEGHSMSILQAVSSSGGVLPTAAAKHTLILRPIMGGPKRAELPVDLKKILSGKANDVPLLAGDILFVPDSTGKRARARAVEVAIQMGTLAGTYSVLR